MFLCVVQFLFEPLCVTTLVVGCAVVFVVVAVVAVAFIIHFVLVVCVLVMLMLVLEVLGSGLNLLKRRLAAVLFAVVAVSAVLSVFLLALFFRLRSSRTRIR